MKTLIRKEIRLLLPAWIVAMLLAIVSPWILPLDYAVASPLGFSSLVQILFPLGVLILGVTSFGQEFSSGTISNLLAQPLDRHRIWRTKTVMLAAAFLVVFSAALASFLCRFHVAAESAYYRMDSNIASPEFWTEYRLDTLEILAVSALVTFSGGLWTTLLLRQMTGAFWFTLLIPAAIVMVINATLQISVISNSSVNTIIMIALGVYSFAGFIFARWLFLHAQDIQWTGGQISFPWHGKASSSLALPVSGRPQHWFFALAWKEIHLHQANLLIAVLLLLLNLASVFTLKIHPHFTNPDISFMLQAVGILWLLMPLIIGGTAVGEERRLGILDSHLCLPVSRRSQLFIKFCVALALSLFLGGAMPWLLDRAYNFNAGVFALAAAIFIISFYASSAARSTIQAIGVAIVICLAVLIGILDVFDFQGSEFGWKLLKLTICVPILLFVFGTLIFWNFKWLHENRKLWRRNVTSVLLAFACIFTLSYAIFYRSWELVTPIQPPSGPARIDSSAQLRLVNSGNTVYIVAPNGRLWTDTLSYSYIKNKWQGINFFYRIIARQHSYADFISGSNWTDVAADDFQALGIQTDGTLWSIRRDWNLRLGREWDRGPFTLAKIGSDTDWSQAAGCGNGFILLKKDGSLWTWGTQGYDWHHQQTILKKLKLDLAESPVRIGGPETYAGVVSSRREAYVRKNDETIWHWTAWHETNYVCTLTQETNLDNQCSNFVFGPGDNFIWEVKTNGGLFLSQTIDSADRKITYRSVIYPLGQNAKWKSAGNGNYDEMLAIRDDGTLWKWPPPWDVQRNPDTQPLQMGTHSDWVALTGDWMFGLALAADGSLWAWNQPSPYIWLNRSRRPLYMGNIFQDTSTTASARQ